MDGESCEQQSIISQKKTKAKPKATKQQNKQINKPNMTMNSSIKTHPYTPASEYDMVADVTATPIGQQSGVHVTESYTAHGGGGGSGSSMMGSQQTTGTTRISNVAVVPGQPYVEAPRTEYSMVQRPKYVFVDSRKPVTLTYCPNCAKEHVMTKTHTKANGTTAICVVAGILIFWPLCWLPLCIRSMKQTNHYCTSCGTKVGRVKPFQ
jgi:LITAF-like zinc ribbon domain